MGWTNYRIADDGTRQTNRISGSADYVPYYRIVSEANVGNQYKIQMVNGTGGYDMDGFYLSKSTDGGDNFTIVDATGGTGTTKIWKFPASGMHSGVFDGWVSIDEGVHLQFAQDVNMNVWLSAEYRFTATLQNGVLDKVFDGGWHYQIKSARLATLETIYTDVLPIQWPSQESLTVVLNYHNVYPLREGTTNSYAGGSDANGWNLDVELSTDGTSWVAGSELVDDALITSANNYMPYGIADPAKSATTTDGKPRFIRFKLENTLADNLVILGTNQYLSLAVYKM